MKNFIAPFSFFIMTLGTKKILMLQRFKFILLFTVLFSVSCSEKGPEPGPTPVPQDSFSNPLLASGPDPWIIKKDNQYYYTHTLGNRISLWKTAKVSALSSAPVTTIWNAPAAGANSKNIWAPELHFLNNKWYVYYTAGSGDLSTQRSFVLENSSADPTTGTWTDRGKIADPAADFFAIDGTVLTHNGINYFIWSGHASATDNIQRIYIARMLDPWTLATARVLISSPQYNWETVGAPPAVNEGPEILKGPTGKVFLIFSASGCWTDDYALGMMTLRDGGDPLNASDWTKSSSPVFSKKPGSNAFGPGHNTFFKSADGTEDWILYHANASPGQGCGDARSPRMQKFTWNADGTPNFGEPVAIGVSIKKPSGE
jgi:GH43 family beta-xylosidase